MHKTLLKTLWIWWLVKVLKYQHYGVVKNGKKIYDKLIRIGVAHLRSMSTKQCDMQSFFGSSERFVPDLNNTLRCDIFVIEAFEFAYIYKNNAFSSLFYIFFWVL